MTLSLSLYHYGKTKISVMGAVEKKQFQYNEEWNIEDLKYLQMKTGQSSMNNFTIS